MQTTAPVSPKQVTAHDIAIVALDNANRYERLNKEFFSQRSKKPTARQVFIAHAQCMGSPEYVRNAGQLLYCWHGSAIQILEVVAS